MDTAQTTFDKKKLGAALGVLAVLAAILIIVYYLPASKKEEPLKTEYTGLELAKELKAFLQKSETAPGRYTSSWHCIKDGGCRRSKISARGIWTMPLGYFGLWSATGDAKYKNLADETLERGLKYQCEELKGEDCMHYALPAGLFYSYTSDPGYQRFNETLRPFVDAHGNFHDQVEKGLVEDDHEPGDYFMHAGHILDFFSLTGEDAYRLAALRIFDTGRKKLGQEKQNTFLAQCQQFLTTVDFYRILKEENYLQGAIRLNAEYQFRENAGKMASAWAFAFCMEGIQGLFELTGNPAYEDGLKIFMKHLMANFMDHPKNNYYTGDFAILNTAERQMKNEKHLGLNLWFMEIFAKMGDIKFSL